MKISLPLAWLALGFGLPLASGPAQAQGLRADYERAAGLRARYEGLSTGLPEPATFIQGTAEFWYRRAVTGGHEFMVMDTATLNKRPAFDHQRLAGAISKATGSDYSHLTLPAQGLRMADKGAAVELVADGARWRCDLAEYSCRKLADIPVGFVRNPFSCAPSLPEEKPVLSPDGKWEALVQNYNVGLRQAGLVAKTQMLSTDGSEGNCYQRSSLRWSPDSSKIAVYRVKPGYRRMVTYVQSSPEDQLQPKASSRFYAKPGDVLDLEQPIIFHVAARKELAVDNALFPNPYDLQPLAWRKDSSAITFEYNQRGHQVYRVIEVDAETARTRAVISEEPKTFFYYNLADGSLTGSGKRFRFDVNDAAEVIWMSERDGWNHLYLFDGRTGEVKNQITKGNWVVRGVQKVDETKRQIWFSAAGMAPRHDPYLLDYYRINFDGSGLIRLTPADSNHQAAFSPDMKYFVDTYSRVDQAPVSELRRAADGSLVTVIERSDISALQNAGWKPPEVFVAAGRDGWTEIVGVIFKPTTFDPKRVYQVIENIYAGPHGSFVPKSFSPFNPMQAQAEMGFIVVQIDGMGTSNRSKAFHDVAWKNLGDVGFPDRILWHQAVAAKYPWYDITRVGIFGGSAGGQSSFGALLFHPDFYKVAVSYAGCHDNRMDKIWWNEQWMGWPIGPQYSASSNVDNAWRLRGDVLFVVGEMDSNVDPASTMQAVNALIKANKRFDLLVVPGAEHNAGRGGDSGPYGERLRFDFFVRHLLGVSPPNWNQ
ncbi:MAG: DPP IV N-terminal domain-containing protein [Vicinamibacteria bacterium]|nr:DPP IV N-terminal domain-containing protein [Vicinamibacteria bacterium]